jgi:hypothetical protein
MVAIELMFQKIYRLTSFIGYCLCFLAQQPQMTRPMGIELRQRRITSESNEKAN